MCSQPKRPTASWAASEGVPRGQGRGLFPCESPPAVLQPALGSSAQGRHGPLRAGAEEAVEVLMGLKLPCSKDRLRVGAAQPAGEKALGTPSSKKAFGKEGKWLLARAHSDRTSLH